jgi:hypothetical protein
MRKNIHGAPAVGGFERSGPNDGQPGSYSGPEVGFEDIAADLREARLLPTRKHCMTSWYLIAPMPRSFDMC